MSESQAFDPMAAAQADAQISKQIYQDFMHEDEAGSVHDRAKAGQDMVDYLNSRPTSEYDVQIDNYGANEPKAYSDRSLKELTKGWAEAEDSNDKTISKDIEQAIFDKIWNRIGTEYEDSKNVEGGLIVNGLTEEHAQALLDRIKANKDAIRAKNAEKLGKDSTKESDGKDEKISESDIDISTNIKDNDVESDDKSDKSVKKGDALISEIKNAFDRAKDAKAAGDAKAYEKALAELNKSSKSLKSFTGKSLDDYMPGASDEINNRLASAPGSFEVIDDSQNDGTAEEEGEQKPKLLLSDLIDKSSQDEASKAELEEINDGEIVPLEAIYVNDDENVNTRKGLKERLQNGMRRAYLMFHGGRDKVANSNFVSIENSETHEREPRKVAGYIGAAVLGAAAVILYKHLGDHPSAHETAEKIATATAKNAAKNAHHLAPVHHSVDKVVHHVKPVANAVHHAKPSPHHFNTDAMPWDNAHQASPGHEVNFMQKGLDAFNKKKGTNFKLTPINGTTEVVNGSHIMSRAELREYNTVLDNIIA